jgi:hypothetical protein
MFVTDCVIRHLYVSPGHNYFGRPKDGPGDHTTVDAARVDVRAGKGIVGDRYFGVAAHFEAQITFVAWRFFRRWWTSSAWRVSRLNSCAAMW